MGRVIIKLTDPKTKKEYYLHWSSIVDAPVTYGLTKKEFKKYYKEEFGNEGMRTLDKDLELVDKKGHSSHYNMTVNDIIERNRAGKNEKKLTKKQIIERYCRKRIG